MITEDMADSFQKGISTWINEISAFQQEVNLWKTVGSITNSAGNLTLHITGGTNYLFGTLLASTGYVRDRPAEFAQKDIPRGQLLNGLQALIPLTKAVFEDLPFEALQEPFPIPFDGGSKSHQFVFLQLLGHLNYHLGQVNYLRRMLQ